MSAPRNTESMRAERAKLESRIRTLDSALRPLRKASGIETHASLARSWTSLSERVDETLHFPSSHGVADHRFVAVRSGRRVPFIR